MQEAGPSGCSFAEGWSHQMIICKRPAPLDVHLQEAGPSGLRMIICICICFSFDVVCLCLSFIVVCYCLFVVVVVVVVVVAVDVVVKEMLIVGTWWH